MTHTYAWANDGRLQHFIDGDLRASVEPKHVESYARSAGLDPDSIPAQPEQEPETAFSDKRAAVKRR